MGLLLDVRLLAAIAALLAVVAVVGVRAPQWLLPGAAALSIVLARPSAVGERVPILGPVVLTAVAAVCALGALRHRTRDAGATPWPFALFAVAWVWFTAHRLFNSLAEPSLGTSTLTTLVPVLAFYFVARDPVLLQRTRSALVTLVVAVSALVVVALAIVAVVGPTASLLGEVPLGYAGSGSGLYFPGALAYGLDPDALFPRMLGVGREPGMGAIFAGWAFFAMPESFARARLWKTVLVLALLATQSTAGIGLFGVCVMLQAVLGRRTFSPARATAAVVIGAGAVYLAVVNPVFGLLSKADSGGDSFAARNQAALDGLTALVTHPFTSASTAPLSSINLIAAIAVNGAPWFFLAGAFLLAPVLRARRRDPLRYGALFVLLTMLTAQPLAGNAGVLLLAVVSYYAAARPAAAPAPRPAPPRAVTSGVPA